MKSIQTGNVPVLIGDEDGFEARYYIMCLLNYECLCNS